MTARAIEERADELAPIIVDLSRPGQYEQAVRYAHFIDEAIRGMPLEGMTEMADDKAGMILLRHPDDVEPALKLREDRALLELLLSTQRQLMKLRPRNVRASEIGALR